jgi:Zn-dependent protease with chaperone function
VLGVYEMAFGDRTKSANAALVGAGPTRRIVVSDTMLAEYSEDEIEVVLAHELAHHAHGDVARGLVVEFLLLLAAGYAASVVLSASWGSLGLRGLADPAGLPLLVLAGGAVRLTCTPLVNAFTRSRERHADAFALALTSRPDAFISGMRRLGAQNLAEENPSRTSVWQRLAAEPDLARGVDVDHLDHHLVPFLELVAHVLDPVVGDLGDVQQAVDPGHDLDERAEIRDAAGPCPCRSC